MKNPWLEIPHTDYENHMTDVGQAQCLSAIMKNCLEKFQPNSFALLGCATGNGLEHINSDITSKVYAIDINPIYLEKTRERFQQKIDNLEIIQSDIQTDELNLKNIDLFFVGLVLEYVDPKLALKKIIKSLGEEGVLVIVIQKNEKTSFVSKTEYTSLEKLSNISNEVAEENIEGYLYGDNMISLDREEIQLTENKSFIKLVYQLT